MKRITILVSVVALAVGSVLGFGLASGSSPAQTQKTYGPGWVNWAHVGPTQPIAQALSGIEGNVGAVYYLNPETGTFLVYVPSKPEVSDLTTMDFGQSYLMLLTAPTAMTIPTEATFLATPTPCPTRTPCPVATPYPDCGHWQSLAEECAVDYGQCVDDYGACADDYGSCVDDYGTCVDKAGCFMDCRIGLGQCVLDAPDRLSTLHCLSIWDCMDCFE